jgi:hypothetical protein
MAICDNSYNSLKNFDAGGVKPFDGNSLKIL